MNTLPIPRPERHPAQRFALASLAAAVLLLAACSSVPDRNAALDAAKASHATAQSAAPVNQLAADELRRATEALRRAEAAHAARADVASVNHLAYLAAQRVAIAQATAESRTAQAVVAGASAERDRMRLALRTAEADATRSQLAASEQARAGLSAEQAEAERRAAAARSEAERQAEADRARLAARDAQVQGLEQELRELNARPTDRGMVVTLGDLLFDTGKSQLQAGGDRSVDQLAAFMKRHPERQALIEGHTDSVGSRASNQSLSERRAQAVRSALIRQGVEGEQLRAQGFGQEQPVADNGSAAGRQQNRRVEIIFVPAEGMQTRR
jgi:outer membrane protein OmpA-like peptidoglycan-associated protein